MSDKSSIAMAFASGAVIAGAMLRWWGAKKRESDKKAADAAAADAAKAASRPVSKFSLAGKNTVVTGGASGIGLAVSTLFAEEGAIVHVLDINLESATKAAESINAAVKRKAAFARQMDVTSADNVRETFAALTAETGPVDVLVNNAGIGSIDTVVSADDKALDRVYSVNVKGVFHCAQAAAESMLASGKGGSIVNLGSIASLVGLKERFSYSMTKGAVLTMTYSIATDYVKKGIRCNAICPARIHTPFVDAYLAKNYAGKEAEKFAELSAYQPVGRMGTPDEVAALALFLASDQSKFITGAAYAIDGGVSCNMG